MKKIFKSTIPIAIIFLVTFCISCSNNKSNYTSIGDSLTWQNGQIYKDTDDIAIGYQQILEENINSITGINNLGISGASLAINDNYPANGSIAEDLKYKNVKGDIVTIFVGTNDFKLNVPIGELNEKDKKTFIGAYEYLLDKIIDKNPDTKIYLLTSLQRNKDNYDINTVNKAGYKLIDYVNATKEIGEKYNIPVMDVYNNYTINIDTLNEYTIDGLHLNNKGYEILGNDLVNFIKSN